jgi:hypothetical protein
MSITLDKYGIIDESYTSLRYPRDVDETFPTLQEAVAEATRLMAEEGAVKVTVCRVAYRAAHRPVETQAAVTLAVNGDFEDLLDD